MSAVTAVPHWEAPLVPVSRRTPAGGSGRPRHLHVVSGIPNAIGDTRVAIADRDRIAPRHITRRGRLVLTVATTVLLVMMGAAGARAAISGAPAPVFDTVTVQSGQTLSQIAHAAYPRVAVPDAVQRVQAANNLNTNLVFGGERLLLPR